MYRLPVIDPASGNILYVITQKPLLKFLYKFFPNLDKVILDTVQCVTMNFKSGEL